MNKVFHMTAPIIALKFMPQEFRDFLIADGFTEEELAIAADLPDTTDKDNLTQDGDTHHAHSYKLGLKDDGQLHWLDGDCLEKLKALCGLVHDEKAENDLHEARKFLGKMCHYRIDALTYPHLHRGKPWNDYHEKFETELGKFMAAHKDEILALNLVATPYHDVYKDCRATAIEMWHEGLEVVKLYENGEKLPDGLKMSICTKAVQGIIDMWSMIAKELKL